MWPIASKGGQAPTSGTLEEKLEFLAGFGFRLAAPFEPEELLSSWPRQEYEKPGFRLVLFGLGMTEERPPWRPHCANMCVLDRECIGPRGAYIRIAESMKRIAQGSLAIENIHDYVSIKEKTAWLEFELHGELVHVDCRVNYDWLDPALFGRFTQLLEQYDSEKTFLYFNSKSQTAVLGCAKRDSLEALKRAGIAVEKLTASSLV